MFALNIYGQYKQACIVVKNLTVVSLSLTLECGYAYLYFINSEFAYGIETVCPLVVALACLKFGKYCRYAVCACVNRAFYRCAVLCISYRNCILSVKNTLAELEFSNLSSAVIDLVFGKNNTSVERSLFYGELHACLSTFDIIDFLGRNYSVCRNRIYARIEYLLACVHGYGENLREVFRCGKQCVHLVLRHCLAVIYGSQFCSVLLGSYSKHRFVDGVSFVNVLSCIVCILCKTCGNRIFSCVLYYSLNVAEHRLEVERKRIALDIYGYFKEVCRVKHSSVVIVRELYVRFLFDYDGLGCNAEALACVVEYYVFVIESYVDDIVACIDYFINGLTFCIGIRIYVFKRIFSLAVYSVHMIESVVFEIAYAAYRSFEYEYLYRLVNACAVSYLIVGVAVGKSYRTDFDIDYRAYRHTLYVLFAARGNSVFANPRTCIVLSRYRLDLYLADNIVYAVIIGYFVCSEVCVYRQRSGQYLYFDILVEVQIQSAAASLYAALRSVYVRCRIAVNIGYAAVNCRRVSTARDCHVQIGSSGISCVCVDTVGAGIYPLERADLLRSIVIECYRGTLHVLIVVILCSRISRAVVTRNRKLVALELNAAVSCHYSRKIEIVILTVGDS